ncbi:7-carboxy-7-deazaguanine synthase QueE, partial [bacterium]|nr:7-carboxy-7-deazaguanine synthase QueE [bacterium]
MKISDIFYSLQGEGYHSGKAAIFVRFFGCNLICDFCDEPLHKTNFKEMSSTEILRTISVFSSKYLVLTGGEPSLNNINPFIKDLKLRQYRVAVETNGYKPENISESDWITYSP